MILDAHTHWGICWEERYGTDPGQWLTVCDRHGIDMAALMGHRGLTGGSDIPRSNDIVKETCLRSSGRLIAIATVRPSDGDAALRELERCLDDLDMRGLKLHPWVQGCSTSSAVMDDLMLIAGDRGIPVIFHDGTPSYSMPSQIGGLAQRFPGTTIVSGHGGLLELWRSALSFAKRLDNYYVTLCGPHAAAIETFIDEVDGSRLMWGSDFGFGWADSIAYRRGLLDRADMDDELRRAIMGGNAARLFRLDS